MQNTIIIDQVPRIFPPRFYARTDHGGSFNVLGRTDAGVIVEGSGTGVLARIVQTGYRVFSRQVRVRFEFTRDIGDQAGTLAFDRSTVGGWAPVEVFQ